MTATLFVSSVIALLRYLYTADVALLIYTDVADKLDAFHAYPVITPCVLITATDICNPVPSYQYCPPAVAVGEDATPHHVHDM